MRFHQLILRPVVLLCLSGTAVFAQSLVLPAPQNLPTSYHTGDYFNASFSGIQGGLPGYFLTVSGNLPPGLTYTSTFAGAVPVPTISGNLTTAGTYTFTVVANDKTLPNPLTSNALTFTITVTTLPVIITPNTTSPIVERSGTVLLGTAIAGISGGDENNGSLNGYTATVASGVLPDSTTVSVGATTEQLLLAGTFLTPGTYNFTVVVSDASTPPVTSAPQAFTVTVTGNPLQMLPAGGTLPGLTTQTVINASGGSSSGSGSSYSPYATGGIPPYTWTITHGASPPGLNFISQSPTPFVQHANVLTGTPSTVGTFSYTLQVQDSSTPPLTIAQTYTTSVISAMPYPLPPSGQNGNPSSIIATTGPAAALWFIQQPGLSVDGVESITAGANPTFQYETALSTIPGANTQPAPEFITVGTDGYLWIATTGNYLYRVKPDGSTTVATIQLLTQLADPVIPTGITSGSDGGVWFTGTGALQSYIGRVSTDGSNTLAFYPLPQSMSSPIGIAQDPGDPGHLWFLAQASGVVVVGRIATNGTLDLPAGCQASNQAFGQPSLSACIILDSKGNIVAPNNPSGNVQIAGPFIIGGSDGAIWFATGANEMGRITTDGNSVHLFPIGGSSIESMALGSDNAIWYADDSNGFGNSSYDTVSRITTTGQSTTFVLPNSTSISGVAAGPDGAVWVTDHGQGIIFQIFPSLALNCTGSQTLQVGVQITTPPSCTAYGGETPYTYTYDASALPPGVTASANGTLSGTPTAPGSFTIKATDSSSPAQQASQVLPIVPAATIQFTCTFPTTGTAAQPYSGSCTTAGGTPPYTYSVTPNLPAGLTGVATSSSIALSGITTYGYSVSGTISLAAFGTVTFTVTAVDSTSPTPNKSTPQPVSISITPIPVSVSCASNAQAIVGKPFQQSCFGSGGAPPYTFTATGLPAGLMINASSGVIGGTPTAAGQSSVGVVLTDAGGQTAAQSVNLSVLNPKLTVLCPIPGNVTAGSPFSATCSAYGGVAPYSYSVSAGSLPTGLALNPATGVLSGTLSTIGGSSFTIQVKDSGSPAMTAQQVVGLFVQPSSLAILTTNLPVPNSSLPYAVVAIAGGGMPPYTFAVSSGSLPGGLQLNPATGVISSAPPRTLTSGPYTFTLQVTDFANNTATHTYSGTVTPPLAPNFTSIALPTASGANGITLGPDGALWFTTLDQNGGNLIGRINTSGVITTTPSANALTQTNSALGELAVGGDIATGPDGAIWIAQRDGNAVGEMAIDRSSQLTYVPPTANSGPAQITAAPDGTLWFTEAAVSQIAHVAPGGSVIEFPTPSPAGNPNGIAVGPDNFIVFTEPGVNKIGVISQDGKTKTDFPIPTASSLPTSIVLGPDNAFWFTEFGAAKIGRMDFSGNITEFPVSSAPQAINLGPDGALYFTESTGNKIGRITILGAVTEIPVADQNSGPTGIAIGSDGALWFTENNLSKIGRLNFIIAPEVSCTLPSGSLPAGSAFSGSCTASQGTPPYTFGLVTAPPSTPPPGVALNPSTGAFSGTLTAAGTFDFAVSVTDSSSPAQTTQHSYSFTVTPLPLSLTCNTPPARLYTPTPSGTIGCVAVNGTGPYTYSVTAGTPPPGLSFAAGAITGTPTTLGDYPIIIQATDSSTPSMTASQAIIISVQYGTITGKGTPLFTLSTPALSVAPGTTTPGLTLSVNETLLQAVSGTAVLTFPVDGAPSNTPAGYMDPALQFVDGKGNPLTTKYNFTFQPENTTITLPAIYVGTVLGTVEITINASGLREVATTFPITGDQPVIQPGSVQFTNVTASGFDVEFIAMTPTRSATSAAVTFNPASGSAIQGQQTFVFDVTAVSTAWFASAESLQYGGLYSLTFPFSFNGPVSAIASATVTLTEGASNTSQPVTGNR